MGGHRFEAEPLDPKLELLSCVTFGVMPLFQGDTANTLWPKVPVLRHLSHRECWGQKWPGTRYAGGGSRCPGH